MKLESKNIWLLPTTKPTGLIQDVDSKIKGLFYLSEEKNRINWKKGIARHIYITSDEEIKEGDWFLSSENTVEKYGGATIPIYLDKKIILTTDQDLIKDGVQELKDDFLEWFVNNSSCEWVIVKQECCGQCDERLCEVYDTQIGWTKENTFYKIIIPKEEEKCICKIGEPYNNTCCKVHGSILKEEKTLANITCTCLRPSPGDFTANCRNCGFRIKDRFDQSLDALKSAINTKFPEQTKCYCGHTITCDCGPELTVEEHYLSDIKQMLKTGNDAFAIRFMEKYYQAKKEQEK